MEAQSRAPGVSNKPGLFAKPCFLPRLQAQLGCSSLTRLCLSQGTPIRINHVYPLHIFIVISSSFSKTLDVYITGSRHLKFASNHFHVYICFIGIVNASFYTSIEHSLPPFTYRSETCPKLAFYEISSLPRYF